MKTIRGAELDVKVREIRKKILAARKQYEKAQSLEDDVFQVVEELLKRDSEEFLIGEFEERNLSESITEYINYGEYSVDGIIEGIYKAVKESGLTDEDA